MKHEFDKSADLGMQLLQLLDKHKEGLCTFEMQVCLTSIGQPYTDRATLKDVLEGLERSMMVTRVTAIFMQFGMWQITPEGNRQVRAHFRRLGDANEEAAAVATVCNAQIPEPAPDVAMICISEPELDGWWYEQDVEIKSTIFLLYVLGSDMPALRGMEIGDAQAREKLIPKAQPVQG